MLTLSRALVLLPSTLLLTDALVASPATATAADPLANAVHASQAGIADVRFAIDPLAGADSSWDLPALMVEGTLAGRLVLRDGAVLSGRMVVDGVVVEPGARIFVAAGTELISIGENRLDGTFVPFVPSVPFVSSEEGTVASKSASADDSAGLGAPSDPCPVVNYVSGGDGIQPPPIAFVFAQSTTINNQFLQVCAGPVPSQMPQPQSVSGTGTRSVVVQGGRGGAGVDVLVECLGNSTLTINGEICNAPGERGADAEAIGLQGPPCECGGDATAYGGNGGRAGHLTVIAESIRWGLFAIASVNFGGDGGDAIAHGGVGGDCPECGVDGGRGGHATAIGGSAGAPGRISVAARKKMVPAPNIALAAVVVLGAAPDGGAATAFAAPGGDAVDCFECPQDGGDGGDAGDASARGGDGGPGQLIEARSGNQVTATLGSDGGDGGNAKAHSQRGGHAGDGATCPCPFPGQAGSGGDGGTGGDATAQGGAGGEASAGSIPLIFPDSGWGGSANATCGIGGDAGSAGGCTDGIWLGCQLGDPGKPGPGGVGTATGGPAGAVTGGADPGEPGDPTPAEVEACADGDPGVVPPFDCEVTVLCCVAGNGPGCGDPACEAAVCGFAPHCCELIWDGFCAELAGTLCPDCGASNCCAAGAQPGCDDPACIRIVCFALPFCCELQWDAGCAELAGAACAVCGGGDA